MDQIMRALPEHYYPTMNLDGFTPEQILMTARRDMRADYGAEAETPPTVTIRTEVNQK